MGGLGDGLDNEHEEGVRDRGSDDDEHGDAHEHEEEVMDARMAERRRQENHTDDDQGGESGTFLGA